MNSHKSLRRYLFFASLIGLLVLSSCTSGSGEIPAEATNTPEPTNTPKPKVACPQADVESYVDELELVLEEWEDTTTRAGSTSRIALSPVIGELQDVRRNTRRIDRPECADYLNDLIIVAMERDIDSFISFLSQDSDSVVVRKMEGAEKAWGIAHDELDKFKEAPLEAYRSFNVTIEELEASLDELVGFERPDGWVDRDIPYSDLVFSIPSDWGVSTYGDKDQFVKTSNPDKSLTFLMGAFEEGGFGDLESDSGRLFSLQTILETSDYDYYLERSANVELHSKNKAYVVEFSVRDRPSDDIEDRIWSVVLTPTEKEVIVMAQTTRDEFAQIDIGMYKTVLGSIR